VQYDVHILRTGWYAPSTKRNTRKHTWCKTTKHRTVSKSTCTQYEDFRICGLPVVRNWHTAPQVCWPRSATEYSDTNDGENILTVVEDVHRVATAVVISPVSLWLILQEYQLCPYHVQSVRASRPGDAELRVRRILSLVSGWTRWWPSFLIASAVSGWSMFHSQRCLQHAQQTQKFFINIWAGIVGDHLIGPHVLPARMNGNQCLLFLQQELPASLEDIPLHSLQGMWIQLDGVPLHCLRDVRNVLSTMYPQRWIRTPWFRFMATAVTGSHYHWFLSMGSCKEYGICYWSEFHRGYVAESTKCLSTGQEHARYLQMHVSSMIRRENACVECRGIQFQHLLWCK
jgi:hypothetical protein